MQIDTFRIIIADDHPHAREAIREILKEYEEFEIIGEANTGIEAVTLAEKLQPDIILMDISMPEMNGLDATRIIKARFPYVKIVMTTVSDDIVNLFEAIKRGAQGYLLKNIHSDKWYEHLKAFAMDEVPLSKEVALQIIHEMARPKATEKDPLTARESEVLQLVAKGKTNKDISQDLFISENTVKNHLKNILQKLQLDNRVQLTSYAFERGWIKIKN